MVCYTEIFLIFRIYDKIYCLPGPTTDTFDTKIVTKISLQTAFSK